jgi:hypothetical protein
MHDELKEFLLKVDAIQLNSVEMGTSKLLCMAANAKPFLIQDLGADGYEIYLPIGNSADFERLGPLKEYLNKP